MTRCRGQKLKIYCLKRLLTQPACQFESYYRNKINFTTSQQYFTVIKISLPLIKLIHHVSATSLLQQFLLLQFDQWQMGRLGS